MISALERMLILLYLQVSNAKKANTKSLIMLELVIKTLDVDVCTMENAIGGAKMDQFPLLVCDCLDDLTNKVEEVEDRLDAVEETVVELSLVDYLINIRAKFDEDFESLMREIGRRFSGQLTPLLQIFDALYRELTNPVVNSYQGEISGDKLRQINDYLKKDILDFQFKIQSLKICQQTQQTSAQGVSGPFGGSNKLAPPVLGFQQNTTSFPPGLTLGFLALE